MMLIGYPVNLDIKGAIEGAFGRFEVDAGGSFSGEGRR